MGLFLARHVPFNIDAHEVVGGIAAHADGLGEGSGELAFSVVGNLEDAALPRLDGIFGVLGNSAAARGKGLVDNEGLVARIRELERATDGLFGREAAEVDGGLVERDDGLCVGMEPYGAGADR